MDPSPRGSDLIGLEQPGNLFFKSFANDYNVLKAMYGRAMVDLEALLHNHSSKDEGFNEMSRLNTKMLSYIYPDTYKELTYNIDMEEENKENVDQ